MTEDVVMNTIIGAVLVVIAAVFLWALVDTIREHVQQRRGKG